MCPSHVATAQVSILYCQACQAKQKLIRRGPHEKRWVGWPGGWELLRRPTMTDLSPEALTEGPLRGHGKPGDDTTGVIVLYFKQAIQKHRANAVPTSGLILTGSTVDRTQAYPCSLQSKYDPRLVIALCNKCCQASLKLPGRNEAPYRPAPGREWGPLGELAGISRSTCNALEFPVDDTEEIPSHLTSYTRGDGEVSCIYS